MVIEFNKSAYYLLPRTYHFGGEVLHASGHLISKRNQVFVGHRVQIRLAFKDGDRFLIATRVGWSASTQEVPQVAIGRIFNDHIQWTYNREVVK